MNRQSRRIYSLLLNYTIISIKRLNLFFIRSRKIIYAFINDIQDIIRSSDIIIADITGKKLKIEIDGENFDVEIKDELDQLLEIMELGSASKKQVREIRAPMPGLVLEITVTDGQEVNEGDKILILQAMKMENSIVIHTQAKIRKIAVTAGQAVEKGQVLVELE